jgi:hypothetical protein
MELLNNQTLVSDYLNIIDLKYDGAFCSDLSNKFHSCKISFGLITSHSSDLKCYTFNSIFSEISDTSFEIPKKYFDLFKGIGGGYLFLHDSNQLPSFFKNKINSMIFYDK